MEKKFRILRIVGTLWKILAWVELVVGILSSVGVLLAILFAGRLMRQLSQQPQLAPWRPFVFGAASGVLGLVIGLVATLIWFLALYAIGELIYLLLNIEENTRMMAQEVQYQAHPRTQEHQPTPQPAPATPAPPEPSE